MYHPMAIYCALMSYEQLLAVIAVICWHIRNLWAVHREIARPSAAAVNLQFLSSYLRDFTQRQNLHSLHKYDTELVLNAAKLTGSVVFNRFWLPVNAGNLALASDDARQHVSSRGRWMDQVETVLRKRASCVPFFIYNLCRYVDKVDGLPCLPLYRD